MCYLRLLHVLISYTYESVSGTLNAVMMTVKHCRYRLDSSGQINISLQCFGKEIKTIVRRRGTSSLHDHEYGIRRLHGTAAEGQ